MLHMVNHMQCSVDLGQTQRGLHAPESKHAEDGTAAAEIASIAEHKACEVGGLTIRSVCTILFFIVRQFSPAIAETS